MRAIQLTSRDSLGQLIKIIRDVFNEDFQKIVIQGREELETITAYLEQVAPDLVERIEKEAEDVIGSLTRLKITSAAKAKL